MYTQKQIFDVIAIEQKRNFDNMFSVAYKLLEFEKIDTSKIVTDEQTERFNAIFKIIENLLELKKLNPTCDVHSEQRDIYFEKIYLEISELQFLEKYDLAYDNILVFFAENPRMNHIATLDQTITRILELEHLLKQMTNKIFANKPFDCENCTLSACSFRDACDNCHYHIDDCECDAA